MERETTGYETLELDAPASPPPSAGIRVEESVRSFRFVELPSWAASRNFDVERPCFLSDHIRPLCTVTIIRHASDLKKGVEGGGGSVWFWKKAARVFFPFFFSFEKRNACVFPGLSYRSARAHSMLRGGFETAVAEKRFLRFPITSCC